MDLKRNKNLETAFPFRSALITTSRLSGLSQTPASPTCCRSGQVKPISGWVRTAESGR